MPAKPHIHYHSDCDFFGGCESMLVNFFNDPRLQEEFVLSFSYRDVPAYVEGLRKRLPPLPRERGLKLLSDAIPGISARNLPRLLALPLLALQSLLLVRYWILAANVLRLVRAWRGQKIDLLHINNGGYPGASSARAAAIAARLLGIPNVIMVVNNIAAAPRWHERPFEALVGRMLRHNVRAFITGSRYANQSLRRRLASRPSECISLHNGIGARQPDETVAHSRQRLGIGANALVFAIVALHEPRKGHRVLIKAVDEMNQLLPPAALRPILLIEGTGQDESELREEVARLGLQEQVLFISSERNVFNLMQSADVLVVPSTANEDFPNVVLEAMSLGTPVLATTLAGIPEQVEDGVSGWLVPPGEVGPLAQALTKLAMHPQVIAGAGAAAQARFREHFSAELAVGRYITLYRDLLNFKEKK